MIPRRNTRYATPVLTEKPTKESDIVAKSAYFLFSGAISALIALLSILLVFALVSVLASDTVFGIIIPERIPNWTAAVLLLIAYLIIVLPLKSIRFKFSPHKSYSLYGSRPAQKYGDTTLWIALFILLGWFVSEHKAEIYAALENFPAWWRNFVDSVGPWFYQ